MNDRLLRALRREPVDRTPVWFMRQAGRALPRYRERRNDRGMFEILRDPPAAAEITAMPLEYFPVDACVLYNDLATPFLAAGLEVEMRPGVGPVVLEPVRSGADVDRLDPFDPRQALDFNLEQIRILVERLDVPVLGFVGSPFTLCSYLVEGPRSQHLKELKSFIFRDPGAWNALAEYWVQHLADFALAQHEAGAGAVQIFDSWAGELSVEDFRAHVEPHLKKMAGILRDAGVPTIYFFTGNPALLPLAGGLGTDAVSVDWRSPIDKAWDAIGQDKAIQGNLDPVALLGGREVAVRKTREILDRVDGRAGHIFNLGHGILPETDHRVLQAVVETVHSYSLEGSRS